MFAEVEADTIEEATEMWENGQVIGEQGSSPFSIDDSLIVEEA